MIDHVELVNIFALARKMTSFRQFENIIVLSELS